MENIHALLQKYYGYATFRPLQEDIINDILAKRDTFVLMPTGGGKSLCYQLPSIASAGVTIVLSPLISLMKDQVDSLLQNGVQAAYLNSSLSQREQHEVLYALERNGLKLLYIAPERFMQASFLEVLRKVRINFFAIDEAHCISQWGHDFRPEYRQLKTIRAQFPGIPITALTATATQKVKEDIISQLQLRDAVVYQASFDRTNLEYYVHPKQEPFQQVMDYITHHKEQAGIIYCLTRKTVDSLVTKLQNTGIDALPYHAGLTDILRSKNQEQFLREETNIIVATIAFGMGINKSNVRFVIHYDMPKSLEHYYQETGRAGRDGLPGECILLFNEADKFNHMHFIAMKNEEEQRAALQQLQTVIRYAYSGTCRRRQLLEYFGEFYTKSNCAGCDNCVTTRDTFDGTIPAQSILACVQELNQRFGVSYTVQVLTGSRTKQILERKHNMVQTYGSIAGYTVQDVKTFIYELIQSGFLQQTTDQYPVLHLTSQGIEALQSKRKIQLREPEISSTTLGHNDKNSAIDTALFIILKALRKRLADEANIPPYLIFADTGLDEMAGSLPQAMEQFKKIYGVGEEKARKYGQLFLDEIILYCSIHAITPPAYTPTRGDHILSGEVKRHTSRTSTVTETLRLFYAGKSLYEIADERGLSESTVTGHLQNAYIQGEVLDICLFVPSAKQQVITEVCAELGIQYLSPIKEKLGENYSYDEIRWIQAKLRREQVTTP